MCTPVRAGFLFIVIFARAITYSYSQTSQCLQLGTFGVYDTRTTISSYQRTVSFFNLLKQHREWTYEQAQSTSASLGIPLGDIVMSAGFENSKEGYQEFVDDLYRKTTYDEQEYRQVIQIINEINPRVLNIISECLRRPGIHARYETTDDPNQFALVFLLSSNTSRPPVTITLSWATDGFTLDGRNSNTLVSRRNPKFTMQLQQGVEKRTLIKRTGSNSLAFTINTNDPTEIVEGGTISLPIPPRIEVSPCPQARTASVSSQAFRSRGSAHTGRGDQELKRWNTTLMTCKTALVVRDNKLFLQLDASFEETVSDNTTCVSNGNSFQLYTPPNGYELVGTTGLSSTSEEVQRIQKTWVEPFNGNGPLISSYNWQGDSGTDKDCENGSWVEVTTRPLIVVIKRKCN